MVISKKKSFLIALYLAMQGGENQFGTVFPLYLAQAEHTAYE